MTDPSDKDHIHELPAGVIVAIGSGRPELLSPFIKQVETGEVKLNKRTQIELLKLVQGLLADRVSLEAELSVAKARITCVDKVETSVLDVARKLRQALEATDLSDLEDIE